MLRYLRNLSGPGNDMNAQPTYGEETYRDEESNSEGDLQKTSPNSNGPYDGTPVPPEASLNPGDATFYDTFFDEIFIAPHKDGTSLIVFPSTFKSQDVVSGKVEWFGTRDGDDWGRDRTKTSVQIYEHLSSCGEWNPRVVRYLGKTNSVFQLERLSLGELPFSWLAANTNDRVLALYQRWALQMLSALVFLHSYGVVLNDLSASSLWLRSDYSVAVARVANAGRASLWVRGGSTRAGDTLYNQWGPPRQQTEPPEPPDDAEAEAGGWKGDLFNWATVMYRFMSGGQNPLEHDLMKDINASQGFRERRRAVQKGLYNGFPVLETKMLGSSMLKAWRGEYESTNAALSDVQAVLRSQGLRLSGAYSDDLDGFDWEDLFEELKTADGKGQTFCFTQVPARS